MNADRLRIAEECKGWLHPGEGEALAEWASKCPGPWFELGTYCGKSTVWLGDAAERTGNHLVTVDWHHGSPEMGPNQSCHDPAVLDADGVHDTVPHLRRTLRLAGLEESVTPIIGKSEQVAEWWGHAVGFAFIDACHGDTVIGDCDRWAPWVTHTLAFHDSDIDAIRVAINRAQADHGFEVAATVESLTILTKPC